ncbi:forkhead-associated protein [Streptomyces sp. CB00455]|uniref:DUF3662 domain-containing protein n=1 Tax=Streptomyces sp. CB00455 TaxID=1703927 RepID=UPI00093FD48E|nr:DUF3662 domain-containing protein [Streptomyces sp. CB00455]OKK17287.1 forkhead-associated protein [Streptomyces sp. CB00455]
MNALSRWEDAVERWEDALLARVSPREPVELIEALRRECDEQAVVCSHRRVVVPNAYEVELPPDVHGQLAPHADGIGLQLTDALARHGEARDYEWAGPLTVRLRASEHLGDSRYRVASAAMPHISADAFPG